MPVKITFDTCDAMWSMDGWNNFCWHLKNALWNASTTQEELGQLLNKFFCDKGLSSYDSCCLYGIINRILHFVPHGYDYQQGSELLRGLDRGCKGSGIEMRVKGNGNRELVEESS